MRLGAAAIAAYWAVTAWSTAPVAHAGGFAFVDDVAEIAEDAVVVDSRRSEVCADGAPSRGGEPARCLPISAFTGPHGRLASFRDINWVFGTVALTGSEHVLVVGDRQNDRDAVAALLHLAGQADVSVWKKPIGALGEGFVTTPGTTADPARRAVYQAPMRDDRIVLRDDLKAALQRGGLLLLDGRSEADYWGERVRGARGGHIAGAQSLPLRNLRGGAALIVPPGAEPVLYGYGPVDGLAYLTSVVAGKGQPARLYLAGFREWAAHGLAVDAESFAEPAARRPNAPNRNRNATKPAYDTRLVGISATLGALFGAIATAGAFALGRRRRG